MRKAKLKNTGENIDFHYSQLNTDIVAFQTSEVYKQLTFWHKIPGSETELFLRKLT